jgi:hypothetical protein
MSELTFGALKIFVLEEEVHIEVGIPGSPEGVTALTVPAAEFRNFVREILLPELEREAR